MKNLTDFRKTVETSANFIALASVWTRSICQMYAIFPGVEFLGNLPGSKKKGKFIVQKTSKKWTKKRDAHTVVFCSENQLFFNVDEPVTILGWDLFYMSKLKVVFFKNIPPPVFILINAHPALRSR